MLGLAARPPRGPCSGCTPQPLDDLSLASGAALLSAEVYEAELLDILLFCGWYHAISFAANSAGVPLEPNAPTFESVRATGGAGSARDALRLAGAEPDSVLSLLRAAMAEDLSEAGYLTSLAVVPSNVRLEVAFTSRQNGVACGLRVVALLCEDIIGPSVTLTSLVADGDPIAPGQQLAFLPARSVVVAERTALTHLSGIATATLGRRGRRNRRRGT